MVVMIFFVESCCMKLLFFVRIAIPKLPLFRSSLDFSDSPSSSFSSIPMASSVMELKSTYFWLF